MRTAQTEVTRESENADGPPPDESQPNLTADILWVYAHLDHPTDRPENAPSAGATSLLSWARSARGRFFEQVLPRALSAKAQAQLEPEPRFLTEEELAEKSLEDRMDELFRSIERSRIEHTPQQILDDTEVALRSWASECGLDLTERCLESALCDFGAKVDDCALAAAAKPKAFARFIEGGGTHPA
jgi:hypothetical protein